MRQAGLEVGSLCQVIEKCDAGGICHLAEQDFLMFGNKQTFCIVVVYAPGEKVS
jgi:hypothetical protein